MAKSEQFELSKLVFTELNDIVAHKEALERRVFRGEGQEKNYTPRRWRWASTGAIPRRTLPGAPELNRVFHDGVTALQACAPFERATAFFPFGALQQFFFDGNKRTSRFMMNGVLMSHRIDAIGAPAARAQEFNEKIVRFYLPKDATEMMAFLASCHPEAETILSLGKDHDNAVEP